MMMMMTYNVGLIRIKFDCVLYYTCCTV